MTVTLASGNVAFSTIKTAIDATGFTASFVDAAGTTNAGYSTLYLNLGNQTVDNASTGVTGGQLLKDDLVFELNGRDVRMCSTSKPARPLVKFAMRLTW